MNSAESVSEIFVDIQININFLLCRQRRLCKWVEIWQNYNESLIDHKFINAIHRQSLKKLTESTFSPSDRKRNN